RSQRCRCERQGRHAGRTAAGRWWRRRRWSSGSGRSESELIMVSKATSRFIRMSPQKARLVVDLIRGKNVNEALMTLKFTNKPKTTREIEKVVKSAVANAT